MHLNIGGRIEEVSGFGDLDPQVRDQVIADHHVLQIGELQIKCDRIRPIRLLVAGENGAERVRVDNEVTRADWSYLHRRRVDTGLALGRRTGLNAQREIKKDVQIIQVGNGRL